MTKLSMEGDSTTVGYIFGRPSSLNNEERVKVLADLGLGRSVAELAREFKTSQTIMRIRESGLEQKKLW